MPAPVNVTPQMERVRAYAERALAAPEGITLTFPNSKYNGPRGSALASRSFQTTFCALRSKAARRAQRHQGDITQALDSHINGRYSELACVRSLMPNEEGWKIELCKAYSIDMAIDVFDRATGEQLKEFDPQEQRMSEMVNIFTTEILAYQKERRAYRPPFTEADKRWIWEYAPEVAKSMWDTTGASYPSYAPGYKPAIVVNSEHDVASVSADDMFAPDPDEEE